MQKTSLKEFCGRSGKFSAEPANSRKHFLLSPVGFDPGSIIQFYFSDLHERFSEVFFHSDNLKFLFFKIFSVPTAKSGC